jgi:hypothetical protein
MDKHNPITPVQQAYLNASFQNKLERLINEFHLEADSDTPDYVLANYMIQCLMAFNTATQAKMRTSD